jgi:hypothetical protein
LESRPGQRGRAQAHSLVGREGEHGSARREEGPAAQEIRELKDELRSLARNVKEGEVPPPVGTALNQIYNTLLRAMDQERRTRETGELEERLAVLEERAALGRGVGMS